MLHSNTTFTKGSNDFRWLQTYVQDFLRLVKEVIDFIIKTPGAHLLLVSVIVSPENHDNNKAVFRHVDNEMWKLAQEHSDKVTFLDLSKDFLRNGQINFQLFDLNEWDQVHLSEAGAAMVAEKLRKKSMSIPKACFKME